MCLAVPGRIVSIEGDDPLLRSGKVDFSGAVKRINLAYVPEAKIGDYVLVHVGFAISIVSQTDSQAVQYSMILLLASVFFSGLFMSLDMLWAPVRVISWLLPTTYGTLLLRNIALRGIDPNWALLGGLIAIGLGLMFISWRLMRRLIASSQ